MAATQFADWRRRVDDSLSAMLPELTNEPVTLHAAMHHAVMLGGKRMRPLLVYASGAAINGDVNDRAMDCAAAAVELVHAYSLVHDDLPCMDDDALRRGQPTVHVEFDEATAVLTGDALQTLAFESLAHAPWNAELKIQILQSLAAATGALGMCGGQALDLAATDRAITLAQLQKLHSMKTGALIVSAVEMGALIAAATAAQRNALRNFAGDLGVAFQIRDDILDVESNAETLGKTAGKDIAQNKSTYPALLGMAAAKSQLEMIHERMKKALEPFGTNASHLQELAELTVRRSH